MEKTPKQPRERAISLIQQTAGRYLINQQAIDIISEIDGNIAVIVVCGTYRTGKSYLLNRMILGRSGGFGVGSSIDACTKGLWMWNRVLKCQDYLGNPISLIVIDSEGLASCDKDPTHDTKIFALSILLSSLLIYNSVGSIDQNAIDNLAIVTNLSKMIQGKLTNDSSQIQCPDFYWILRDFSLQLFNNNGKPISENQYLENSLRIQRNSTEEKNKIRKAVTGFFKNRNCFTLVRPVTRQEDLQNLEKFDMEQLRPEFSQQVLNMRRKIFAGFKPKELQGKKLNGQNFCELINLYVNAINKGSIPNIDNTWNHICKNECQRALTQSTSYFENYIEQLLGRIPLNDSQFKKAYKEVKKSILNIFSQKVYSNQMAGDYAKELKRVMKTRFELLKNQNQKQIQNHCKQFVEKQFRHVESKITSKQEIKTFEAFVKEIEQFKEYFKNNYLFRGVTANMLFNQIISNKLNKFSKYFSEKISNQTHYLNTRIYQQKETIKMLETEVKHLKQIEITRFLQNINQLNKRLQSQKYQINEYKTLLEGMQYDSNNLEEKFRKTELQKIDMKRLLQEYRNKINLVEQEKYTLKQQFQMYRMQNQTARVLNENKLKFYQNLQDTYQTKQKDYLEELGRTRCQYEDKMKDLVTKMEIVCSKNDSNVEELELKLEQKVNECNRILEQKNQLENKYLVQINEKNQKIFMLSKDMKENKFRKTVEFDQIIKNLQKQLQSTRQELSNEQERNKKIKKELDHKNQKIVELENSSNSTIQSLEENLNEIQSKYDSQIDLKTKINHDLQDSVKRLEYELKVSRQNFELMEKKTTTLSLQYEEQINDLQEEIRMLQNSKTNLMRQVNASQNDKNAKMNDLLRNYEDKIANLQKLLSDTRTANEKTRGQQYEEYKLTLNNLRRIYEQEKENMENGMREERRRYQKQIDDLKLNQEEKELEIRQILQKCEDQAAEFKTKLDNMSVINQNLENANRTLGLLKNAKQKLQEQVSRLNTALETVEEDKKRLLQKSEEWKNKYMIVEAKLEDNKNEIYQLTKQNITLKNRIDNLDIELRRKKQRLEEQDRQTDQQRDQYRIKWQQMKHKYHKSNQQFMNLKTTLEKDLALAKQNNQFLTRKIQDLKSENVSLNKRIDESTKMQRNEAINDLKQKLEEKIQELESLEKKYEKSKKSLKELQSNYLRQVSSLEGQKVKLQELLANSMRRNEELMQFHEQESIYSNSRVSCLEERLYLTSDMQTLELDKFKKQNEQLRRVLDEYQKKQLSQITRTIQKEKPDINLRKANQALKRELDDLRNQYKGQQKEFEVLISAEREEKRMLKDKVCELEIKVRAIERGDKRMKIERTSEQMLIDQIDMLKKQRDQYLLTSKQELQQLNEIMNTKVEQLQRKLQLQQGNNKRLRLEIDKEHMCFNLAKQNLMDKINQLSLTNELLCKQMEAARRSNLIGVSPRNKYKFRLQELN